MVWYNITCCFVRFGCQIGHFALGEKQRLKVLGKGELKRVFGSKSDAVMGVWRTLHNEELHKEL
jgi:hypothetical protein